jgi:ankyrin repeat protein
LVEALLDRGADINARIEHRTLLHWAVSGRQTRNDYSVPPNPDLVRLLLDRGAVIESRGADRSTPLHLAVMIGTYRGVGDTGIEIVTMLLDRGVSIEAQDANGATPCQLAEGWDHLASILDRLCPP